MVPSILTRNEVCQKYLRKERETLKVGGAGSLAIFNCSVCSLQQPPLQIMGALEVMGDSFLSFFFLFFGINLIYYTTGFRLSEAIRLILHDFFFSSSKITTEWNCLLCLLQNLCRLL